MTTRVLHVTKVAGISGSENHLLLLLPALRERGFDVSFVMLHEGEPGAAELAERLEESGVAVERLRLPWAADPRAFARLVRIVRRVDGLPLAIELAGAMLRLLTPHQLLDRLDARPASSAPAHALEPAGGSRGPADRRRSLRATMDWSYDLLTPDVQCLYRRLGVFSGTFGLRRSAGA